MLDWDRHALVWINGHHSRWLDAILIPVSYLGEAGALWFALGLALLAFGPRRYKVTGFLLLATIILTDRLLGAPLAHWAHRTRPYLALDGVRQVGHRWPGSSFPSAHAHSVWIAALLLGSKWPRLRAPLLAFALLTCYSRPYLGMHYPGDVLAGSLLGIIMGCVAVAVDRRWQRRLAGESQ